jgi:hypothetical protein
LLPSGQAMTPSSVFASGSLHCSDGFIMRTETTALDGPVGEQQNPIIGYQRVDDGHGSAFEAKRWPDGRRHKLAHRRSVE